MSQLCFSLAYKALMCHWHSSDLLSLVSFAHFALVTFCFGVFLLLLPFAGMLKVISSHVGTEHFSLPLVAVLVVSNHLAQTQVT